VAAPQNPDKGQLKANKSPKKKKKTEKSDFFLIFFCQFKKMPYLCSRNSKITIATP
jgi:hypothetical protein